MFMSTEVHPAALPCARSERNNIESVSELGGVKNELQGKQEEGVGGQSAESSADLTDSEISWFSYGGL